MSVQAEQPIFLCTCLLSQLKLSERAIHSVLPAQLKEGTEVYVINEIPTSYLFVRRPIPCGYLPERRKPFGQVSAGIDCPCTHSHSVSISYVRLARKCTLLSVLLWKSACWEVVLLATCSKQILHR